MEDLRLTRRNGYAIDSEEFQPGVVCFGAAIRDHAGAVIGSVSCSMPLMRAKGKERDKVEGRGKTLRGRHFRAARRHQDRRPRQAKV